MRYHHHHHHLEARHLRKLGRTAVWNREKAIILIAMGVWVTDVGFLINGDYLYQSLEVFLTSTVISQVPHG
jgi:hypothetical protein